MGYRDLALAHDRVTELAADLAQLVYDAHPAELEGIADRLDLIAAELRRTDVLEDAS